MLYKKYQFLNPILDQVDLKDYKGKNFSLDDAEEIGMRLPSDWSFSYGASKLVFINDTLPYVVKIPFAREGDAEYLDGEPNYFSNAYYSMSETYGWDYCRSEKEYFQKAQKAGVSVFFAGTKFIGTYHHWPIYIQEKVVTLDDEYVGNRHSHSNEELDKSAKKASNLRLDTIDMNDDFLADLWEYYSEKEIKNLFHFLNTYAIDDLKASNVGYDSSGTPVIVDYSGFEL